MIENIKPMDIEKRSFEIITEILGDTALDRENELVIKRVIHTTADFDYADTLCFTGGVLEKALDAIRGGVAEVAPVRFRRENPCNYCDWRGVCLYDERLDARRARRFEKMKPDEALLAMKRAADGQKEGIDPPDEA